jgi:integrase
VSQGEPNLVVSNLEGNFRNRRSAFWGRLVVVPPYPLSYTLVCFMPHVNRLTDLEIRSAPPRSRPYSLSDGWGLSILINPDRSKWWRFRYRYGLKPEAKRTEGKNQELEKSLSCGVYPEVGLKEARALREKFRALLRKRVDPAAQRKVEKLATGDTVEVVCEELLTSLLKPSPKSGRPPMDAETVERARGRLKKYVYPSIGVRPIGLVTVPELYAVLKAVQDTGKYETCKRVRQWCGKAWRLAVLTGRAPRNIVRDLWGALIAPQSEPHAAIVAPERIGGLLRAIDGYSGGRVTCIALQLAPILFQRHVELRAARWTELDLMRGEWRLARGRMKMRRPHIVPLPRQALELLVELHRLTGHGEYLFPNVNDSTRPMSENTLNSALRAMGFEGDEMTVHGFRTLASTRMNELGIDPDLIELLLAHLDPDPSRRAYNRAMRLRERRHLAQWWADLLDAMRLPTSDKPVEEELAIPPELAAAIGRIAPVIAQKTAAESHNLPNVRTVASTATRPTPSSTARNRRVTVESST